MFLIRNLFKKKEPVAPVFSENTMRLARHIESHGFDIRSVTKETYHAGCGGELPTPGFRDIDIQLSDTTSIMARVLRGGKEIRVFGCVTSPTDDLVTANVPHEAFSTEFVDKVADMVRNRASLRAAALVNEMAL